jgi:hypothetical protein
VAACLPACLPYCLTACLQFCLSEPSTCLPRRRRRVEEPLAAHLEAEGLQFIQFAFRWVNCLLLREVPFPLAIRLWDTYLSEG